MPDAGEVVWLEFPGAVVTKRRPAVVLSSKVHHSSRPDVIVGLVTSQIARTGAPSDHILADWAAAGLHLPSAFRAFIATIPRAAVISSVGRLSAVDWKAVQECVQRAVDL
jgi:mRNA interferase MazF